MRTLLLMVLAAAVGVIAAVQITGVLRERDAYPRGVMDVMAHHFGALRHADEVRQCAASATTNDFAMMDALSGDIPQAFPGLFKEQRFTDYVGKLRSAIGHARANPPADCPALHAALVQIDQHCDECHREYR